jgi:hypothetical protein
MLLPIVASETLNRRRASGLKPLWQTTRAQPTETLP